MQAEPEQYIIRNGAVTQEAKAERLAKFAVQYPDHYLNEVCACGRYIGMFGNRGARISGFMYDWGVWAPATFHGAIRCGFDETNVQAECEGPYRKGTGAYVGCSNCEPYVRLSKTRDSAYVYGVQWNDFQYQVFDGDEKVEGVLECRVGLGGYIIQVRRTPDAHHCPCYLAEEDPEVEAKICRLYLPGNNFRVEESSDS